MIGIAAFLSAIITIGALEWGYLQANHTLAALFPLLLGLVWRLSAWQRWRWGPSLLLVTCVGASAFGASLGLPVSWALVSTVAALAGADLTSFWLRLGDAEKIDVSARLEQRHLARTLAVAGASLLLVQLGQSLRVRLSLGMALLLGVLAIVGLSRGVALLRKESG